NNPLAQDEALKLDLIPYLLDLLSSETDIKVSSRLLYALSSVVRGNKESIQSINDNQGLSRLATVYQKLDNNDFRAKCAVFVADFIDPNMFNIVHNKFNLFDQTHHDIVSPFEYVIEIWCNLLQDTLFDDMGNDKEIDFDTREKILSGISMIKSQYSRQCPIHIGFKNWLSKQTNSDSDEYLSLVNQVKIQYGLT
ncbi:2583_t:CDS:1, partial [Racocetra persica]